MRLPNGDVAAVIAKLLSSREGGIPQLAAEIAGTLELNEVSCERRLRAIANAEGERVDLDVVDWILQGAGATHLWYEPPLLKHLPEPGVDPVVAHDETCAECGRWIDWTRGDSGVRVELRRPRRWPEWWSLCARCYARSGIGADGYEPWSLARLLELYEVYLDKQLAVSDVADWIFRDTPYLDARSCAAALLKAWKRNGWPLRSRSEQLSANTRRRGTRRRDGRKVSTLISEADLRKLHVLHQRKRISINSLCRQTYERYGYANANSMVNSVSQAWKALGLEAHDRIEMTVHASTKNGLSPRDDKLRRARRKAAGLTAHGKPFQEPCTRTRADGKPCRRKRALDLDVCAFHKDEEARAAHLAAARMKSPKHTPANLTTVARVQPVLREWFDTHDGRWAGLPDACGFSNVQLGRWKNADPARRMMIETAERIEAAIAQLTAAVPMPERGPDLEEIAA